MKELKIDFIIHWLWVITFGLLLVSGIPLMGPKFGWIISYKLAFADYLHRVFAAFWVILTLISIVLEAIRSSKKQKPHMPWLVIGKTGMGIFTLVSTLLFVLSGIYLWYCKDFSHSIVAFALTIHDLLTLISLPVIMWHIYDKAYAIPKK